MASEHAAILALFYWSFIVGLTGGPAARPRFKPANWLLLLTLAMAFTHLRHQSVFIIVAVMIVIPKLGGPARERAGPLSVRRRARHGIGGSAVTALVIVGVALSIPLHPRKPFPIRAADRAYPGQS